jgi:triacylglycerol lipase
MLIPGFMASDITLAPLANFIRWLGHRAEFAGIWSNSKCPRETMMHLGRKLNQIYARSDAPVVVIGQSLGGVYARGLAREFPEQVERVISLGSPIRSVRHTSNVAVQAVARSMAALRGRGEGCLSEQCKCGIIFNDEHPADVPVTLVYSRTDGVVHWESCVDTRESELVENVEVMGSHVGMGLNADVYRVIADRLALPFRSRQRLAALEQQAAMR